MARIGRVIFALLTILSALACVAVCGLWVRSQFRSDVILHGNDSDADTEESDAALEARRPSWSLGQWYDDWSAESSSRGLAFCHAWADTHVFAGSGSFGFGLRGWKHNVNEVDDASTIRLWPTYERHGPFILPVRVVLPVASGDWTVTVPFWLPVMAFGTLPVVAAVRLIRRRRWVRAGHCPRCGYDLRATPGRCPECGAATTK